MKTKELIARLQEADPSGELHCCVGNADIQNIDVESAYWDGRLQIFEFDEYRRPVRAKRTSQGSKVCIRWISISDAVEYPDFVVEYETEEDRKRYEPLDMEQKRADKQVEIDVCRMAFVEWVFKKIQSTKLVPLGWVDRIKEAAEKFFNDNRLGPDNPIVPIKPGKCFRDCEEEYWDEVFSVVWDQYSRIIIEQRQKQKAPESVTSRGPLGLTDY